MVSDTSLDPVYSEITVSTSDDNILEREECLCVVLSPLPKSTVFFDGSYEVQLCFEDNEGKCYMLHANQCK